MKKNKLIRWWFAPSFPERQMENILNYKPQGLRKIIRNFFRTWLLHPVKRRVAKYYLIILRTFFGLKVVGITGSAGKTTTKEMLASILKLKGETVASFANIDPVFNIPTTILKCTPTTKYLVLEMGIEYPGEMDFYLSLAKPDVGIITNIYPTHTLFFGDEKGVAKEKGKLVKALNKDSVAVLNKENVYLREVEKKVKSKIIWFGKDGEISAKDVKITKDMNTKYTLLETSGKIDIQIPVVGEQFVANSLAAASAAFSFGLTLQEIKRGLENYKRPEHRMNVIKMKNGAILFDDSYNSNPEAAKEALKAFKTVIGNKKSIVIFGDMLELGSNEVKYHKELGKVIKSYKFDYLIGVGNLSKNVVNEFGTKNSFWVKSSDEVLAILKPILTKNCAMLVKGSRSIGLDKVVSQLS